MIAMVMVGLVFGVVIGGLASWLILARAENELIVTLEQQQRNSRRARIKAEEQLASHRAHTNASIAMLRAETTRLRDSLESERVECARLRSALARYEEAELARRSERFLRYGSPGIN